MVSKGKRVWLINPVAMPPQYESRIQTLKKAQYLGELGYDVTIIGGSYMHNTTMNLIRDGRPFMEATYDGIQFIHIRNITYRSNGLKRIYSMLEFHVRLWWLSRKFKRPDIIEQIAAVPFGNIVYFIAKRFRAKFVVNVVDLWPESFVAYGLISRRNLFVKFAYKMERWLYKRADVLVFSMEGGKDYILEKGWDTNHGGPIELSKVHYINNGVDLEDFDRNRNHYQLLDPDLEDEGTFKVTYIGSIRRANNLQPLVDAAKELLHISNIKFLVYGDGDERVVLEQYCKDNQIDNVIFKQKWVALKYVPYILSRSSLNILNYRPSPILRFGGSQSKSFQYMASGRPICANVEMNYCPIKKYNIGIARFFNSSAEYANAILSFYNLEAEKYSQLCSNARSAAKDYDYKKLTKRFEELIQI